MNSGDPYSRGSELATRSVPAVVYQTYLRDEQQAAKNMICVTTGFTRSLFLDADCEADIEKKLGRVVLHHYRSMSLPAHRAEFFSL